MGVDSRPLVMHVVHRFDTGGLENGVVSLINHMPPEAYRHMVVAVTEVTDFRLRLQRADVACVALQKPPGHGVRIFPAFSRLLAEHGPAIVHTRNLSPLELQVVAAWHRVPARIHGEHGRDVEDLDGTRRKYQWIRRGYSPFVHRYVALSRDLAHYLTDRVGVSERRVTHIYNGVNTERFRPRVAPGRRSVAGMPFSEDSAWLVGSVGRMQGVKNQILLAQAFVRALALAPQLSARLRLVMIGDGPLRAQAQTLLSAAGVEHLAWLPGERIDVPEVMQSLDCFVLPSLAEGISNTILEAMATGLPVIATAVGGNVELVSEGRTGWLVPAADAERMAEAIIAASLEPERAADMGRQGRVEVERRFSLQSMVTAYRALYDRQLGRGNA